MSSRSSRAGTGWWRRSEAERRKDGRTHGGGRSTDHPRFVFPSFRPSVPASALRLRHQGPGPASPERSPHPAHRDRAAGLLPGRGARGREALRTLDVRLQGDLTDVQRQILQVQELTGQSQRRLSEMKAQLDARAEQVAAAAGPRAVAPPDSAAAPAPTSPVPPPAVPNATADQMYQGARLQLNRGSLSTARRGFQDFLAAYPNHELVPDALYSVAETFYFTAPDSALAYYVQVIGRFPKAAKASTALYKMGRMEEDRKNAAAARTHYERLLKEYPASPEADLARNHLRNLRP
ncbi:MAG: hypothetical protein DMD43_03210 [Gemmatimonadetes bacterium]|nr:MAG: hypothetical protein DMD43_03210 [Gemmatimonadota bacterium]